MTSGIFHPPLNASILQPAGGSAPYHADAVHWDGTSYLGNATLASGQHNKLSFAVWFNPLGQPPAEKIGGFCIIDPESFNFGYFESDSYADTTPGYGGMQFTLIDVDGSTYLATGNTRNSAVIPQYNIWYVYMVSANCSTNLGPVMHYLGDLNITNEGNGVTNEGGPSAVIQGNGVPIRIGTADPNGDQTLDMANLMIWYGTAIDWTVEANRRKIIDAGGKPVDPAEAVLAFGTPTVMLTGDATAFQTNEGSGGSFSLTGSLTNASTSPSD